MKTTMEALHTKYEVTVGNIGTTHTGTNAREAIAAFTEYVNQSAEEYGRAAGEPVTLWKDGEPWREYEGTNTED